MHRIIKLAAIAVVPFLAAGCIEKVDTGNAAVIKSFSGSVDRTTGGQGIYGTFFSTVYEVSGKEDTISFENMHPKSKDNLTMEDLDVDITIQIDPTKAAEIYIRFSNDLHWNEAIRAYVVGTNYVARQARAVIYRVAAMHDAQTMHQLRPLLEREISEDLQKELDHDMGTNWIVVRNVNIKNLITDRRVEESIREIAAANFKTQQKIAEQAAAIEEAKRLEIERVGVANADARKMQIEAEAKAKANRTVQESLTPQILQSMQIEAMREFAGKGTATVLIPAGQSITPMINTGR